MLDRRASSWFYPTLTGDPGRDRNARTLQFACLLAALGIGAIMVLNAVAGQAREFWLLGFAVACLVVAAVMNRAGRWEWAARTAILAILLTAILLVLGARDGFRSHAMLIFPGLLLISVMLLDRASYIATAIAVLLAVTALGVAELYGFTGAPPVRTATSYGSIFSVGLNLLAIALIGGSIARDSQKNVSELRKTIAQFSDANIGLKQSAEALRESELKYRRLHESISDAVVTVDMAGHILESNQAYVAMLGYTREELSRLTYQELTPERWRAFEARIVEEQILPRGCSDVYEKEYRRRDGTVFPVELRTYLLRDRTDQPIGMWAIIRDITERKQTEEALRASEGKFASVFRFNPVSIAISDPEDDGRAIDVNDAFEKFSGYPREEVLGGPLARLWSNPLEFEKAAERFQQSGRLDDFEFHFRHKNGQIRTGLISGRPIELNGKKCVITSATDITDRKQAEAALRESEERFRNMADTAPVMIWIADPDKKRIFFNQPWLDFTGRRMEEEMGDGWTAGVHTVDFDRWLSTYSLSFDARREFQMEYRLRRADGEYRWILDHGKPLYRAGDFVGYIGSCIDITEQKMIEERLRANQARLMDAQRLAKIGSWEQDPKTGAMHWSEESFRVFGPPDMAPRDFATLLKYAHPKDREKILEADHKARSGVEPVEVEHRIVSPDGQVRFARSIVQAIRDEHGLPVRLVGATQDISEQVLAMELLRDSERRLRIAERLAHVGHWEWDRRTDRVSWSDEILRILGIPVGFAPGLADSFKLIAPQDKGRLEEWIKGCLEAKTGRSIEVQVIRPDGELRTLNLISEVVLDEDGRPARIFGSCQDVTDTRRAQEEVFARQKLESLGTLASGIAHDFNNLLGAVLAQAELAAAEFTAGSYPDDELNQIRTTAIRGSEIVRQLMVYAGKEGDVPEPVDVSKTVEEMLSLLKASVSKRATLVTDLQEGLPAIKGRVAQLRQILMNLIVNASDAIKEQDGVIRVTAERVTVTRDTAGSMATCDLPEGDYVRLEVSDTGCGMSQEMQARIFDPFFTTKSAGRGLGLPVVHGIVRSLNGAIRVLTEPGKGATFQVLLPCAAGPVPGVPADAVAGIAEVARSTREANVLVVEDEEALRLAIRKMLGKTGFGVLEAADGTEAIELLRAKAGEIDLVLLDMTLPGATSREVLDEAVRVRPEMKVILTSAYSEETVTATLNAPQICGFVRKPFQFANLVETLRNALSA